MALKQTSSLTFQIPTTIENPTDGLTQFGIVLIVDSLQIEILYHSVHS